MSDTEDLKLYYKVVVYSPICADDGKCITTEEIYQYVFDSLKNAEEEMEETVKKYEDRHCEFYIIPVFYGDKNEEHTLDEVYYKSNYDHLLKTGEELGKDDEFKYDKYLVNDNDDDEKKNDNGDDDEKDGKKYKVVIELPLCAEDGKLIGFKSDYESDPFDTYEEAEQKMNEVFDSYKDENCDVRIEEFSYDKDGEEVDLDCVEHKCNYKHLLKSGEELGKGDELKHDQFLVEE